MWGEHVHLLQTNNRAPNISTAATDPAGRKASRRSRTKLMRFGQQKAALPNRCQGTKQGWALGCWCGPTEPACDGLPKNRLSWPSEKAQPGFKGAAMLVDGSAQCRNLSAKPASRVPMKSHWFHRHLPWKTTLQKSQLFLFWSLKTLFQIFFTHLITSKWFHGILLARHATPTQISLLSFPFPTQFNSCYFLWTENTSSFLERLWSAGTEASLMARWEITSATNNMNPKNNILQWPLGFFLKRRLCQNGFLLQAAISWETPSLPWRLSIQWKLKPPPVGCCLHRSCFCPQQPSPHIDGAAPVNAHGKGFQQGEPGACLIRAVVALKWLQLLQLKYWLVLIMHVLGETQVETKPIIKTNNKALN